MCRYCDPSYSFPSQQDVINFAVRTSLEYLQVYPAALVVVGSYTIGKERLFHGISCCVYDCIRIVSYNFCKCLWSLSDTTNTSKFLKKYYQCQNAVADIYNTRLTALFPGLPGWACTRKVKPIWILLKRETMSGSGISWAICKSAPSSSQITMPAPHHSVFCRPDALLLPNQQRQSTVADIIASNTITGLCY